MLQFFSILFVVGAIVNARSQLDYITSLEDNLNLNITQVKKSFDAFRPLLEPAQKDVESWLRQSTGELNEAFDVLAVELIAKTEKMDSSSNAKWSDCSRGCYPTHKLIANYKHLLPDLKSNLEIWSEKYIEPILSNIDTTGSNDYPTCSYKIKHSTSCPMNPHVRSDLISLTKQPNTGLEKRDRTSKEKELNEHFNNCLLLYLFFFIVDILCTTACLTWKPSYAGLVYAVGKISTQVTFWRAVIAFFESFGDSSEEREEAE